MKRLLREPLVHFLLLGACLFFLHARMNRAPESAPDQIVVSAVQVQRLTTTFTRFQQRPPTPEELKTLIDQYVREEVLSREAVKLGLDQDDTIIRRRLQQKMEFVATDLASAQQPTEAELSAWLASHPDDYRQPPRFSFRQVYFNPARRGDHLKADLSKVLAELQEGGASANTSALGDSRVMNEAITAETQSAIAAQFGPEFADQLKTIKLNEWSGPIRSGYGQHLVLLTKRDEGAIPPLADVRDRVERDVLNDLRTRANQELLSDALARYSVTIEWPKETSAAGEKVARLP